jgi:phage-related protein (TIGR01555 family)
MQHTEVVHSDGWMSALTGIGDPNADKRLSHQFAPGCNLTYEQIADLWRRDDIAAKAIEGPTTEAFREGYELDIPDEGRYAGLKEEIDDELERLDVDKTVERAYQYHRAYGGAAILIGAKDGRRLDQPLDDKRANVEIEYLNVFEPIEIEPAANYDDPFKAKYGKPQWYKLTGARGVSPNDGPKTKQAPVSIPPLTYIHESRLIVFEGIKTSNICLPQSRDISPFWGESMIPRFIDILRDCGVSYAGAGHLAIDVSQPVISIEGLKQMVGKNEEALRKRFRAIEMSRSIARAIVLDAEKEKYERQTTQLTGIPDLLDRLSQRLAAAVGIPLSVLFGYSPASLGTPDNKELELWYNSVRNIQRRELTPHIRRLIKMIMRSLRQRKIPTTWKLKWHDLEHMTVAQRAEMKLTVARADNLDTKSGTIYPDEIRKSRWVGGYSIETQIDEKKKAPGFMAPLPAGVVPKADPANGIINSIEAQQMGVGTAAATGGTAHAVGGYVRRNPTNTGEPTTKVGGGAARSDADGAGGLVDFGGFPVVVENPKGSVRHWIDAAGNEGDTKMRYAYGYIPGSQGTDGDSVDVYLGPNPQAPWVYIIHQYTTLDGVTWSYDEDKVMLGFDSPNHARDAYLTQYDDDRFFGGMEQMSVVAFARKVFTGAGMISHGDDGADEREVDEHLASKRN